MILKKRSRYYQVFMDTDCLEKGGKFENLKTTYVVFICTFDYFSLDEPMYVVESYIRKNNLHFDDGTSKILLNTKCSPDKVPEQARAFYAYINDPTKVGSKLIEGIDERVKEYNTKETEKLPRAKALRVAVFDLPAIRIAHWVRS